MLPETPRRIRAEAETDAGFADSASPLRGRSESPLDNRGRRARRQEQRLLVVEAPRLDVATVKGLTMRRRQRSAVTSARIGGRGTALTSAVAATTRGAFARFGHRVVLQPVGI